MGFKSIVLLIIIVLFSIFSLQNLQSISLVFWGFNSLALPLSVWIILSLLAGIISSLIVQLLSNNSSRKNNYNQSSSPQTQSNYPPPSSPIPVKETVPQREKRFSPPSIPPLPVENQDFEGEFDDRRRRSYTEDNSEEITDDIANIENPSPKITNPPSYPEEKININENQPIELDKNIELDKDIESNLKDNLDTSEEKKSVKKEEETPSDVWLKTREASLYSYQPREKTEFKTSSPKPNKNKQSDSFPPRNQSGIYDAPYRVISPGKKPSNQDDDLDWEDEEDDWDF